MFRSFEGRISSESLKDKVANLIRIWKGWQIFEEEYYTGLELTLLKKKKKSEKENPQYNNAIKAELEEYEDELLEIISENPEELKAKAKEKGVSIKGELSEIISKLLYLKEQKLISEFQSVINFLVFKTFFIFLIDILYFNYRKRKKKTKKTLLINSKRKYVNWILQLKTSKSY